MISQQLLCDVSKSVLCVVDLQGKIFQMTARHKQLKAKTPALMKIAEQFQVPVLLTEQYPQGLGETDEEIKETFEGLTVEKHVITKTAFSCVGEPVFRKTLGVIGNQRVDGPLDVVLIGIETHICVLQTALDLLSLGHRVFLLEDVTSSSREHYRANALSRMEKAGVIISNFESLAFEWTRDKNHDHFKVMSRMIREVASLGLE